MRAPRANVEILSGFFSSKLPTSPPAAFERLGAAAGAMAELVDQARPSWALARGPSANELAARRMLAESFIFERALTPDTASKEASANAPMLPMGYKRREVRLALLNGIYKAATGDFWGVIDPSGITSWIGSEDSARVVLIQTLTTETRAEVVAALLRLLNDAAAPASWFPAFATERIAERLDVRAREAAWTTAERRVVSALTADFARRVTTENARAAMGELEIFAQFPTGDGTQTATTPPPARPLWRKPWLWVGMGLGLVGGGAAARLNRGR